MQQQGDKNRICIHGSKEKNQRERREISKAPLHLEIIFSLCKLSLSLFLKVTVFSIVLEEILPLTKLSLREVTLCLYSTQFAPTETCGEVCDTVQ